MDHVFQVMKKELPNGHRYAIMRNDGKFVTRRKLARNADEVARMLTIGVEAEKLPPEKAQVLKLLPIIVTGRLDESRYPYCVKTEGGFVIRKFLLDFQARWWHEAYMWRRQELLDSGRSEINWSEVSSLLDGLERGKG